VSLLIRRCNGSTSGQGQLHHSTYSLGITNLGVPVFFIGNILNFFDAK